jgi:hypothetical protein
MTKTPAQNPLEALKIDTAVPAEVPAEAAPVDAPVGPPSAPYDPKADHGAAPEGVRVTHVQTLANGAVIEYLA